MINKYLKDYLKNEIIPIYNNLDLAHQSDHVYKVIKKSLKIAKDYDVNLEMIYVIAVFHDVGLITNRKNHHIIGGEMLLNDSYLNAYFSKDELKIMSEAVEDHRASNDKPPRSIYGKIIAEADRSDNYLEVIERTVQYGIANHPNLSFEESYQRILLHIEDKYGENGYLKVWLNTKGVNRMLSTIRKLLKNEKKLKKLIYMFYHQNR